MKTIERAFLAIAACATSVAVAQSVDPRLAVEDVERFSGLKGLQLVGPGSEQRVADSVAPTNSIDR